MIGVNKIKNEFISYNYTTSHSYNYYQFSERGNLHVTILA